MALALALLVCWLLIGGITVRIAAAANVNSHDLLMIFIAWPFAWALFALAICQNLLDWLVVKAQTTRFLRPIDIAINFLLRKI